MKNRGPTRPNRRRISQLLLPARVRRNRSPPRRCQLKSVRLLRESRRLRPLPQIPNRPKRERLLLVPETVLLTKSLRRWF
ncbi:hypothetical protein CpipJ_CPIJ015046 [Culex quinquefasciatus]|uniref:Uncharacterized protein n=1 Tax=Culex quinquefasciatus TaxID=7176 RepID=B0X644_CULQU|nr:hypothetical protein CpipJ_CPIJ015046 [Culex quinquefasciatus]|eukprot:XP_001865116.1 hypothetical protein CpipJ_CPIJ015046 [Culex quinquefasciatus]